jgi:hypothetical protein
MPLFAGDIFIDLKKSGTASKDLGMLFTSSHYSAFNFIASKIKFFSGD